MTEWFINPYQFFPFVQRDPTGELADLADLAENRRRSRHASYAGTTGTITVTFKAATPIVVLDPSTARPEGNNGHRSYGIVRDRTDVAYLPATSIKGALRALAEAVSQSRFGVFTGHDQRLGYRPEASNVDATPARITRIDLEGGTVQLREYLGTDDDTQPAAWFPVIFDNDLGEKVPAGEAFAAAASQDCCRTTADRVLGTLAQKSDWAKPRPVAVEVRRANLVTSTRNRVTFWRLDVERPWVLGCSVCDADIKMSLRPGYVPHGNYPQNGTPLAVTGGVLLVSGVPGTTRKHDERLAFGPSETTTTVPLDALDDLIIVAVDSALAATKNPGVERDDVVAHLRCLLRGDTTPAGPGDPLGAFETFVPKVDGWVYVHRDGSNVTHLGPALITRRVHNAAPAEFLPDTFRRARNAGEWSLADRLFGWAPDGDAVDLPLRGRVRVGDGKLQSSDARTRLPTSVPLAVLSSPKPQQTRFYLGEWVGDRVQPLPAGETKEQAGYRADRIGTRALRGWKVYPHHRGLGPGHWRPDASYRPWLDRRPAGERDEQSRSLHEWIPPGAVLRCEIDVENLAHAELALLLTCLGVGVDGAITPGWHLRVGYAKPLGFGSLEVTGVEVAFHLGEARRDDLATWEPSRIDTPMQAACPTLSDVARDVLAQLPVPDPVRTALRRTAEGPEPSDGRIEYPWVTAATAAAGITNPQRRDAAIAQRRRTGQADDRVPHRNGLAYEWFTENSTPRDRWIAGLTLPDLADTEYRIELPVDPRRTP
jgi:hypothetical protein